MSEIRYLDAVPPKHGRALELYPGLFWARIQLPFKPGHVNAWLLADKGGWTIIDVGFDSEQARSAWTGILGSLGNPRIGRVILTHAHFDHIGLAGWLCASVGAPLWIARTEFLYAKYLQSEWSVAEFAAFYREAGSPHALLDTLTGYRDWTRRCLQDVPARFVRIKHGDRLQIGDRAWAVMASGGHSLEQLAFWSADYRILIGGDQVLPRICAAIHVAAEQPDANPLADAFAGWERLGALPPETIVLPSHGEPFCRLHLRLGQLVSHHERRLEKLTAGAIAGISANEALGLIYEDALPSSPRIATGEMLAHLNYLAAGAAVRRERCPQGVWRFTAR